MRIDVNRKDKIIEELNNELRVTKNELNMQWEITGVKSETIKEYKNKVEMLNGNINELKRHNLNLHT